MPVGDVEVPAEVSVTVAVQVAGALTESPAGLQVMLVELERWLTVRTKLPELPRWSVSEL